MRIALVGQPNSGKSTLFNALVGLRAVAANFPGTTVEILRGRAVLAGKPAEIVDLPGIYSLHAQDPAERVARNFLLSENIDAIVNVVDASVLSRSLTLTL
ncbi:MAG: FeoB small GTPase domain-containing protein, partial [Candidatus Bipolaricaulaceae bacterium]